MKFFFLAVLFFQFKTVKSQSTFSQTDIDAAGRNAYETLLTNVEPDYPDVSIMSFLQTDMNMVEVSSKFSKNEYFRLYATKTVIGKEEKSFINYKITIKPVQGYKKGIVSKVEVWGDYELILRFFINFWSNEINFKDVKEKETVSTRFLTDVATVSFLDSYTAKITVTTSKDR